MQKKYPEEEHGDTAFHWYNKSKSIRHQIKTIMGLKADNCNHGKNLFFKEKVPYTPLLIFKSITRR